MQDTATVTHLHGTVDVEDGYNGEEVETDVITEEELYDVTRRHSATFVRPSDVQIVPVVSEDGEAQ